MMNSRLLHAVRILSAGAAIALAPQTATASTRITAQTQSGPVTGTDDGQTTAFLGVPYAAPPTGPLRFRPPAAPPAWTTPRDATRFGPACPQTASLGTPSTNENCLTLSVFRPDGANSRAPVLVFLFGGSFLWGSAGPGAPPAGPDYDGRRLAARTQAVIVTVNYRLGVLGFLASPVLDATDPRGVSGNYGLLDQQQALRWVRANAASLGYDASRVTLFGQSAGAVSIAEQIASPGADGLFGPVLLESPGALPDLDLASAEKRDAPVLAETGCAAASDKAACLRAAPVSALLASDVPIGPVIDGVVIPSSPAEALVARSSAHAPFVEMTDRNEASFFIAKAIQKLGHAPTATDLDNTLVASFEPAGASAIEAEYGAPTANPGDTLASIATDEFFSCPAAALHAALAIAGVPVLQTEFSQPNPVFDYPVPAATDLDLGDPHTSELAFIFEQNGAGAALSSPTDQALSAGIGDALALLARTTTKEAPVLSVLPAQTVLEISTSPALSNLFAARHHCDFWSASGLQPQLIDHID